MFECGDALALGTMSIIKNAIVAMIEMFHFFTLQIHPPSTIIFADLPAVCIWGISEMQCAFGLDLALFSANSCLQEHNHSQHLGNIDS